MHEMIDTSLQPTDGLIVENNHLAAYSDRWIAQRQQCGVHVLLPQVTYEVDSSQN